MEKNRPWTAEEDEIIISAYENKHNPLCYLNRTLDRTYKAITMRVFRLQQECRCPRARRIATWTNEEVQILIKYAKKLSVIKLALVLGKTPRAVKYKIDKLALTTKITSRHWTATEEEEIMNPHADISQLARDFNRSEGAIKARIAQIKRKLRGESDSTQSN